MSKRIRNLEFYEILCEQRAGLTHAECLEVFQLCRGLMEKLEQLETSYGPAEELRCLKTAYSMEGPVESMGSDWNRGESK